MTQKPDYEIRSLARGLAVLRCYEDSRGELHLSGIAKRTGLPLPTVLRIARTLVAGSFLEQTESGAYRPGLGVLRLGFAALDGMEIVRLAGEPLRELARRSMETINLAVLDDIDIRYLVRVRNADLVTADIRVGSTLPASCTSMGKLLLAYLPEAQMADRLLRIDFRIGRGPNAIRDRDTFVKELAKIRERDWSTQDEELAYGLRSIAVPIRDRTGTVVAAANLAVPATRWSADEMTARFLSDLSATAMQISHALGLVNPSKGGLHVSAGGGVPPTAGGQRPPAPQPGGAAAPFTDAHGTEMETPSPSIGRVSNSAPGQPGGATQSHNSDDREVTS